MVGDDDDIARAAENVIGEDTPVVVLCGDGCVVGGAGGGMDVGAGGNGKDIGGDAVVIAIEKVGVESGTGVGDVLLHRVLPLLGREDFF